MQGIAAHPGSQTPNFVSAGEPSAGIGSGFNDMPIVVDTELLRDWLADRLG